MSLGSSFAILCKGSCQFDGIGLLFIGQQRDHSSAGVADFFPVLVAITRLIDPVHLQLTQTHIAGILHKSGLQGGCIFYGRGRLAVK